MNTTGAHLRLESRVETCVHHIHQGKDLSLVPLSKKAVKLRDNDVLPQRIQIFTFDYGTETKQVFLLFMNRWTNWYNRYFN